MTEANAGVAAINRIPAQFSIFKGQTAARFQLQKPEKEEDRFRTGCISFQIAPYKEMRNGNRIYNWEEKKISSKLGVNDLTNIIYALESGGDVKLFHEFNGVSKSITMNPNTEKGGYFLAVQQNGESAQKLSIPLTAPETYGLLIMMKAALPLIHNWF